MQELIRKASAVYQQSYVWLTVIQLRKKKLAAFGKLRVEAQSIFQLLLTVQNPGVIFSSAKQQLYAKTKKKKLYYSF